MTDQRGAAAGSGSEGKRARALQRFIQAHRQAEALRASWLEAVAKRDRAAAEANDLGVSYGDMAGAVGAHKEVLVRGAQRARHRPESAGQPADR